MATSDFPGCRIDLGMAVWGEIVAVWDRPLGGFAMIARIMIVQCGTGYDRFSHAVSHTECRSLRVMGCHVTNVEQCPTQEHEQKRRNDSTA